MKKREIKALGQHFLKNPRVLKKVVQCISLAKDELIILGLGSAYRIFWIILRTQGLFGSINRYRS